MNQLWEVRLHYFNNNLYPLQYVLQSLIDYNCTDGDVRFRKQFSDSDTDEGRVEYCYEHHWTPFCVLHDEEATVICKSKGHLQYTCKSVQL